MKVNIKFWSYGLYGIRVDCEATADAKGELESYCYAGDPSNYVDVVELVINNAVFRFDNGLVKVKDCDEESNDWNAFPESFWNVFPKFADAFEEAVKEEIMRECHRTGSECVD